MPCDDGWISQGAELKKLPYLSTIHREVTAKWEKTHSETAAMELAALDLFSGNPLASRQRLAGIESREAALMRRDAALAILRSANRRPIETSNSDLEIDRQQLGNEVVSASDTDEDRLVALRVRGDAAAAEGDLVAAMNFYLEGLDLVDQIGRRSVGYWSADVAGSLSVRAHRVLLGEIHRILEQSRAVSNPTDPNSLGNLEQLLSVRLESVRQSGDQFAVQKQIDRLLPLEWARKAVLTNSTEILYGRSLQKSEPVLLSAAGSHDPSTRVKSWELLSALQMRSGWRKESEILQRYLLSAYPGIPGDGGRSLAVDLASEADRTALRDRLLTGAPEEWPLVTPRVQRESVRDEQVYSVPVPVQFANGSCLEGLDVAVDRTGRFVRFTCGGIAERWGKTLPGEPRVIRSGFANYDQVEAHAVGRLLLLRVGSEVFVLLPFNERGEPIAQLLYAPLDIGADLSILPNDLLWRPDPVPAVLGIRHDGSRLIDGFGRVFSGIGPVRSGYFCFRSQSRLVCLDTQTGMRLWERLDLPVKNQVLGDDDFVYVWNIEDQVLQTLSAIDGRLINEQPWTVKPDDVLLSQSSQIWHVNRSRQVTVTATDVREGVRNWTRQFPADSIPFVMDRATLGVVEPAGVLHLLNADTGAPLGEALTIERPAIVERIVCLQDAQRWYVCISGPVPRFSSLQADQLWGGSRVVFVNGWLYGVEKQSAATVWRRFLENEPLPKSLPQSAPIIVQMWRHAAVEGGNPGSSMGLLRLLDKRTGTEILTHRDSTMYPYFALIPAENREFLDVRTERETFHLNYSAVKEPAPAENNPSDRRSKDE